jgi:hypothetical protein
MRPISLTVADTPPETPEIRPLTCFVIGPIGNRHAAPGTSERETYEEALEVYENVIEPACRAVGLEPVRADGLERAGEITEQVFRRLRDDDVVIADLTGGNQNVMYELGLRHTREKLTLQIGEFGRLPFDVNVIRTVQFSRSPYGLIQARDELIGLLKTGLAGEFDPVSATRIWGELAEPSVLARESASERDSEEEQPTEPDDAPGFLDLVAEAEEQQDRLVDVTNSITKLIEAQGRLAADATAKTEQSDAQGRGMKGRLAVLVQYAEGLNAIAQDLESEVLQFEEAMAAVSGGNLAIIEQVEQDPSELNEPTARNWALLLRRMAQISRDNAASSNDLVQNMMENAKLSRVLRDPTRRTASALDRFVKANAVMDEWDRRLQALGVPIPPDDWEPENNGDDGLPESPDADPE